MNVLPWSRAYALLQTDSQALLFSMTRTEERENLFKWVGSIDENLTELIARKDSNITIQTIADLHKYKIGVVINDVGEQLLLAKGVPKSNLQRVVNRDQVQHLLNSGRVDLSPDSYIGFINFYKTAGYDPNDYESVYVLNRGQISYAFNKNTPDQIIQSLQHALDAEFAWFSVVILHVIPAKAGIQGFCPKCWIPDKPIRK
ncbi:MAG: ABC transporter substrate-binding protein [Thermodesulfobacteriota bacterium]|nr:ABC transporter substrate-binding protein [Thermodesulfobacteriota bacterium]